MCHKTKNHDHNSRSHNSHKFNFKNSITEFPKSLLYIYRESINEIYFQTPAKFIVQRDHLLWDILPRLLFDPSPTKYDQQRKASKGLDLLVCYLVVPLRKEDHSVQQRNLKSMRTHLNIVYASLWAGSFTLGLSSRSWIPRTICVTCYYNHIRRRCTEIPVW